MDKEAGDSSPYLSPITVTLCDLGKFELSFLICEVRGLDKGSPKASSSSDVLTGNMPRAFINLFFFWGNVRERFQASRDRSCQVVLGVPGSRQGHIYLLSEAPSQLCNTRNRCHSLPGVRGWAGRVESWGLQAELEDEGGTGPLSQVSCPIPGGTVQDGSWGRGLPKISPLVTQPPVVASVTRG